MMDPESLYIVRKRFVEHFNSASYAEVAAWLLGICWVISIFNAKSTPRVAGAPVHGHRSKWEPSLLLQIRFTFSAYDIISSGYKQLKDIPFVVRRYDVDITVLPVKYLDEMRLIPRHKLNGKLPQVNNLVPRWTWTQFMMNSDLIVRVLNGKLTPDLNKYVDIARRELEYAWDIDIPQPDDWTEVDIQQAMRMVVSRMSAKIFVGYPACRNMEWLKISIEFTYDVFAAAFTMRMFPPWLHPIVAHFVPARWRLRREMKVGKRIVGELMQKHRDALKNGEEPEDTLLGWMIDNGTEKETELTEMAARQCALTLASIHTTSLGVSNVLFDLCAYPEWILVLREEIEEVTRTYGRIGEKEGMTSRQWLSKLEKMDSLIVESQRINPPILLRPQRVAMVPLTLKDGTHIPKGARVAWAGHHHANDPNTVSDPDAFDPMRNYRKRHSNNGENLKKFNAGQTDVNSLAFGYGGQACPGRYFAVSEIKLLLSRLLIEFDLAYPEGKSRPKNMFADENVFMDPHAKLMMRKRKIA